VYVARMAEMGIAYNVFITKEHLKRINSLNHLGVDGRIILKKSILQK
jgi:hypothetical protein